MEEPQTNEQGIMNKETMKYFLDGLRIMIKRSGMTQAEFADGVTSSVNLSNILREKVGTSEEMRSALAKRAGKDISEIVLLGKQAESYDDEDDHQEPYNPSVERRDIVSSLSHIIAAVKKTEENELLWKSCMEAMPVPLCIVDSKGIVIFQNQADRSLFKMNIEGDKLCPACRDNSVIPHPCHDCAIKKVVDLGEPIERHIEMMDGIYRIISSPFKTPKGTFVTVMVFKEMNNDLQGGN